MSNLKMTTAFDADNCPLKLWLDKYNASLGEYKELKGPYLKVCNELKDLTGWSVRQVESSEEWGRDYV